MISRRRFLRGTAAYATSWQWLHEAMDRFAGLAIGRSKSGEGGSATSTRIGNFYFQAPNGIAFIRDDAAAFVINPGGSYNAGIVSPDDSFHRIVFSPSTVTPLQHPFRPAESGSNGLRRVDFKWSRMSDVIVGRLVSAYPCEMRFGLNDNWPGFSSEFSAEDGGVKGVAKLANGTTVTWRLKTQPAVKSVDATQFTVDIGGPEQPTYVVAGFGELPSFDGIDDRLAEAEREYEDRCPKAQGPSGDILAAIADNLNNSRIYSNDNKRLAISVSRTFASGSPNSCAYFCWDSFFNGLLACLDDPLMGRDTVRAMLSYQSADGMVPNWAHSSHMIEGRLADSSTDRSQPPVGAMCVWKTQLHQPDIDFLREVYPKLAAWNSWWMKARNARNDGLLQWGSSTGTMRAAQWETGWDDTPHFEGVDGVHMVGNTMNVYAVDLCSLWAADAHYLALIAAALGLPEDAKRHRQDSIDMNQRINTRLWNEELGIYCSRFWNKADGTPGDFLTRLTPANFYPLISGAPDRRRADKVLAVMTDPKRFWGEWILPTVSREDPAFLEQTYWHGTVWGPVNYLVFQGVKRYGTPQLQATFAQKSVQLFMNNWLANGYCGENFLSINGSVGGDRHYTWGALLCLIGIESVIDVGDDGNIRKGPGFNEPVELKNLPMGGKPHTVSFRFGAPTVMVMP